MPTKIEWADETWNPIRAYNLESGDPSGISASTISTASVQAATQSACSTGSATPSATRPQDSAKVELYDDRDVLHRPLGWRRPRYVFVCSMTDLFLETHPAEWLIDIFANMALARSHTFQVLTKRPENAEAFLRRKDFVDKIRFLFEATMAGPVPPLEWVWPLVPTSISACPSRIRIAPSASRSCAKTPAGVRFVPVEPKLAPVDLGRILAFRIPENQAHPE